MQLNPARGRKRDGDARDVLRDLYWVYAAQPREGTETASIFSLLPLTETLKVYAAQPREGTETWSDS